MTKAVRRLIPKNSRNIAQENLVSTDNPPRETGQEPVYLEDEVKDCKVTNHGQTGEEGLGSEESDVPRIDYVDFTPKKIFSLSEVNDEGHEVDYESDSQKVVANGSPSSLQLDFDSPFSFNNKDLSVCIALPKNPPAETTTDSSLDCVGAEDLSSVKQQLEERKSKAPRRKGQKRIKRLEKASVTLRTTKEVALKREHNSSDDSDSVPLKPAWQKMKGEGGAIIARFKRWSTMPDPAQEEQSHSAFKGDLLGAHRFFEQLA